MKGFNTIITSLLMVFLFAFQVEAKKPKLPKGSIPGIYAIFNTDKGDIIIRLEHEKSPMTVANFVGLAEGKFKGGENKEFTKPFYDGLKFHRVIAKFMIQGGDPQGTGMGDPGYKFFDETDNGLIFDREGILAMANSGPNTNGSQFFITHVKTPHLNGKHTIFGYVVQGQNVVDSIAQNDLMNKVTIVRNGKQFKTWDASKVFADQYAARKLIEDKRKEEQRIVQEVEKQRIDKCAQMSVQEYSVYLLTEIQKTYPNAKQTESGLVYVITDAGTGEKAEKGNEVSTHYLGTFLNGTKFDSSYDRNQPLNFKHATGQMIPGYDEAISLLSKGGKGKFIIPYYNAYGPNGRAPQIPPYTDLVFDIQLMDIIK